MRFVKCLACAVAVAQANSIEDDDDLSFVRALASNDTSSMANATSMSPSDSQSSSMAPINVTMPPSTSMGPDMSSSAGAGASMGPTTSMEPGVTAMASTAPGSSADPSATDATTVDATTTATTTTTVAANEITEAPFDADYQANPNSTVVTAAPVAEGAQDVVVTQTVDVSLPNLIPSDLQDTIWPGAGSDGAGAGSDPAANVTRRKLSEEDVAKQMMNMMCNALATTASESGCNALNDIKSFSQKNLVEKMTPYGAMEHCTVNGDWAHWDGWLGEASTKHCGSPDGLTWSNNVGSESEWMSAYADGVPEHTVTVMQEMPDATGKSTYKIDISLTVPAQIGANSAAAVAADTSSGDSEPMAFDLSTISEAIAADLSKPVGDGAATESVFATAVAESVLDVLIEMAADDAIKDSPAFKDNVNFTTQFGISKDKLTEIAALPADQRSTMKDAALVGMKTTLAIDAGLTLSNGDTRGGGSSGAIGYVMSATAVLAAVAAMF